MQYLKQTLQAGGSAIIVNPSFMIPSLVEYIGDLGFGAVMLDCEHSSAGVERVEELARAARATGIDAIVRPEESRETIIVRYLDCRIDGIMVPHVHDADEARRIVDIVRYARPAEHANTMIIAMIESMEAVKNLDSILAVDGIDVFFVARNDLSKSMGHKGDMTHPAVLECVKNLSKEIVAAGRVVGGAGDINRIDAAIELGMRLIYVQARSFMSHGAKAYLDRAAGHNVAAMRPARAEKY